jgi:hypothetical protein
MRKLAEHDACTVFLSASDAHEPKSSLTAYRFFAYGIHCTGSMHSLSVMIPWIVIVVKKVNPTCRAFPKP